MRVRIVDEVKKLVEVEDGVEVFGFSYSLPYKYLTDSEGFAIACEMSDTIILCRGWTTAPKWVKEEGKVVTEYPEFPGKRVVTQGFIVGPGTPVAVRDGKAVAARIGDIVYTSEKGYSFVRFTKGNKSVEVRSDGRIFVRGYQKVENPRNTKELKPIDLSTVTWEKEELYFNGCRFGYVSPILGSFVINSGRGYTPYEWNII